MGAANTPAYRGTAYVVFEELPLERFGNRLPQLSFEVFRPILDGESAESLVRAVTLIPASGEFAYATEVVRREVGETTSPENVNAEAHAADIVVALDRLEACAPKVESVSLVVAWFGDDLRAGHCRIRPGVEVSAKSTTPENWSVNGVGRGSAHLVSRDDAGPPGLRRHAVRQRGGAGDPGAEGARLPRHLLPVHPDGRAGRQRRCRTRTRTTPRRPASRPIPGAGGSPARRRRATPAASTRAPPRARRSRRSSAIGRSRPTSTSTTSTVEWDGDPDDWGLRRMILHYAHLCAAAGGVDAFLIGSELRGITQVRSGASTYPAVAELVDLAADVRSILGSGHEAQLRRRLVGVLRPPPAGRLGRRLLPPRPALGGRRDRLRRHRQLHAARPTGATGSTISTPRAPTRSPTSTTCAPTSRAARASTGSTPAPPTARRRCARRSPTARTGKPWVFRYKDFRSWWSNPHRNRPGGVESGSPTAWVPESKPIRFTEIGCPAVDRGPNQPNVFYDPKSAESFLPYFSRGWRDDAVQRRFLEAVLGYWAEPANNPMSGVYSGRMITTAETAAWTWDARPYPAFPARSDVWTDADNWRLGHWLNGRLGSVSLGALVRELCRRAGLPDDADRRLGARRRRARLPDLGAREPARLDRAAGAAVRLRRGRERGRDPLPAARPAARWRRSGSTISRSASVPTAR